MSEAASTTEKKLQPVSDLVTVTIDGKQIQVPKGMNLIEAAKSAAIDIPHYCYHKHLSIAGNCRMCQVQVKGQPKMTIACNTQAAEGMEVATHHSSKDVANAQAATLEFILINHPLDCTVCDQAGHCKLQDYHFEYNARSSRFLEEKVHKAKAVSLGPTVMLDGERCIMCSRCIRFCDEVTGTSELGLLNRGDQTVIAVSPGKELNNPLSGSVVDLCPVGALTHKKWRFNTRIWFTKQTDAICPGCSTGCNVKVAERDGQIVQVKARLNSSVNKEWLCDEGRYGFERFLPKVRLTECTKRGAGPVAINEVLNTVKGALKTLTIIVAPDLLCEEYAALKNLLTRLNSVGRVAVAYRERTLTELESKLISPDYAANFRGAQLSGLVDQKIGVNYEEVVQKLKRSELEAVLLLGGRSILPEDIDAQLLHGIKSAKVSVAMVMDAESEIAAAAQYVVPGRSILEKSGLLLNRAMQLQYTQAVVPVCEGSLPEWRFIGLLAEVAGAKLFDGTVAALTERDVTRQFLSNASLPLESGATEKLTIATVKNGGVTLLASPAAR